MNPTLTSLSGLLVGHFTHPIRPTGCTVVLCPQGAVAGVDVRGAAPGTRETDLLAPGKARLWDTGTMRPIGEWLNPPGATAGLALHAGTGSFVAVRAPDGTVHYAGGLGWRLGDPGSGYDIGRRGIARALLDLQAGMNTTKLAQALCQHMGLQDVAAITRKFYQDPEAAERIAPTRWPARCRTVHPSQSVGFDQSSGPSPSNTATSRS